MSMSVPSSGQIVGKGLASAGVRRAGVQWMRRAFFQASEVRVGPRCFEQRQSGAVDVFGFAGGDDAVAGVAWRGQQLFQQRLIFGDLDHYQCGGIRAGGQCILQADGMGIQAVLGQIGQVARSLIWESVTQTGAWRAGAARAPKPSFMMMTGPSRSRGSSARC
jgi:hypothetical protein